VLAHVALEARVRLVHVTIMLTDEQRTALHSLSERTRVPQAVFVRTAVELILGRAHKQLDERGKLDFETLCKEQA
jgi:predicted transcriptional regulator